MISSGTAPFVLALLALQLPLNSDIENIGLRDINSGISGFNRYTLQEEIALGRQLAAEMDRRVRLVDDVEVNEYVNRIGQNVAANSDTAIPITIKVVQSDDINTMALPGGFVYVNTATITTADNEAEVAMAIAYAVAHVAARQSTENASKGQLLNLASIPLNVLGGSTAFILRQQADPQVPQLLEFSRDYVREADFLGLQYLYNAGYDPAAAVTLLQKVEAQETADSPLPMFRTHPPTAERIGAMRGNIDLILPPRDQHVLNTVEFDRIKRLLQN